MNKFYNQFKAIVLKVPNNNAILCCNESRVLEKLLYKDLLSIAEKITVNLQKHVEKHACIGIVTLPNSLLPAIIMSIQKADSAFFCFDEKMAPNQILNLANTIGLNLVFTCCDSNKNPNVFSSEFKLLFQEIFLNYTVKLWRIKKLQIKSYKDISYIIQTSGTTGINKIVKVFHNCITSNVNCLRNIFEINMEDIIYLGTPVTFDPFIIELMLALTSGATLLLVESQTKQNNILLLETLFPKANALHSGVTILQVVPSIFLTIPKQQIDKLICEESSLRILALGGEKFPEQLINLERISKNLRIFNLYGITEISCWASIEEIRKENGCVSIGTPLDETLFQIRDSDGNSLQSGEGELYIGSSSRICVIDDEHVPEQGTILYRRTGDIVSKDESTQKIYYVGRKDDIIKRYGHRVSLCEIERLVFDITNLNSVCICDASKSKLVLFVVVKETDKLVREKIIDRLRIKFLHTLPKWSNPDFIELIPSLPLTRNGKVDKKCLLNISKLNERSSSNQSPCGIFQNLWSKYFGTGIYEIELNKNYNFLNQGGNSILAIQLISEYDGIIQNTYSNKLMAMLLDTTKTYEDYISLINIETNSCKSESIKRPNDTVSSSSDAKVSKIIAQTSTSKTIDLIVKWKYNLEACVDANPVYFEHPNLGKLVAIGSHSHIFVILDAFSGNVISQAILKDAIENAACITSCRENAIVGCNDSYLYCINIETGKTVWKYKTDSSIKCTPTEYSGTVIFGSYDKSLYCINLKDASEVWKVQLKGSIKSNPIIYDANKAIYVATILGSYYCICHQTGAIIWKYEADVPIFGSPCLINHENLIVWADVKGYVNAYNCDTGDKLWTFKVEGFVYSSMVNTGNAVLFGCSDHNVYYLKCTRYNCDEICKIDTGAPISTTPYIFNYNCRQYFISANNKGKLCLFDMNNFVLLQSLQLPDDVFSSPIVNESCIYVGCRDNCLYCIEIIKME